MDRERVQRCRGRVKAYRESGPKVAVWAAANGVRMKDLASWCAHAGRWQARLDGVRREAPPLEGGFVAASISAPVAGPAGRDAWVSIELQAGATKMELHWPLGRTRELAQWLREVGRGMSRILSQMLIRVPAHLACRIMMLVRAVCKLAYAPIPILRCARHHCPHAHNGATSTSHQVACAVGTSVDAVTLSRAAFDGLHTELKFKQTKIEALMLELARPPCQYDLLHLPLTAKSAGRICCAISSASASARGKPDESVAVCRPLGM